MWGEGNVEWRVGGVKGGKWREGSVEWRVGGVEEGSVEWRMGGAEGGVGTRIGGNNTGCTDVWVMCLWSEDN